LNTAENLRNAFQQDPLQHLWDEDPDTLHTVVSASAGGLELKEVRATIPAKAMLTRDILLDGRLFGDLI
jgi:hypothetical protein